MSESRVRSDGAATGAASPEDPARTPEKISVDARWRSEAKVDFVPLDLDRSTISPEPDHQLSGTYDVHSARFQNNFSGSDSSGRGK